MMRDGPGFGIYFCVFEALKRKTGVSEADRDQGYNGLSSKQVAFRQFISGGLAGCSTWTIAYPADVLKTNI